MTDTEKLTEHTSAQHHLIGLRHAVKQIKVLLEQVSSTRKVNKAWLQDQLLTILFSVGESYTIPHQTADTEKLRELQVSLYALLAEWKTKIDSIRDEESPTGTCHILYRDEVIASVSTALEKSYT